MKTNLLNKCIKVAMLILLKSHLTEWFAEIIDYYYEFPELSECDSCVVFLNKQMLINSKIAFSAWMETTTDVKSWLEI